MHKCLKFLKKGEAFNRNGNVSEAMGRLRDRGHLLESSLFKKETVPVRYSVTAPETLEFFHM